MQYGNNTKYKCVFESKVHGIKFYEPEQYHISRYIAAGQQGIYSSAGVTKEYLEAITGKMLEICNSNNTSTAKTDMALLAQNIRVRLKYPVDEDCAIRMGAIYAIAEGEEADTVSALWIKKKMDMCKGTIELPPDPDMYAFFLNTGYGLTKEWDGLLTDTDTLTDYLTKRNDMLLQTMPF